MKEVVDKSKIFSQIVKFELNYLQLEYMQYKVEAEKLVATMDIKEIVL